ncbi:MAG: DUF1361 domain-containing protein [Verrucomicrobia bacterium]|nr:DUF1361 domain-containing protein [Verrucomicrobiota bacterium]
MNNSSNVTEHRLSRPVLALVFSTLVGIALVCIRFLATGREQLHLVWNLFLAWLPLIFALNVQRQLRAASPRRWKIFCAASAWLIFFPNAPYICTDLVHLTPPRAGNFWIDLVLILLFAMNGLMLGFVSLYLMQDVVTRKRGAVAGWSFAALVIGLSALGVYIGRFLRWNSWDLLTNPLNVFQHLFEWSANRPTLEHLVMFTALFGTFLFLAHVMLYALTHLHPGTTNESVRDR